MEPKSKRRQTSNDEIKITYIYSRGLRGQWLLCSCNSDVVYDKYNHTQLTGWEKNDTLAFDVPPMKESGRYRLELGLRTSTSFPFTGLSLVVDRTVATGTHAIYRHSELPAG